MIYSAHGFRRQFDYSGTLFTCPILFFWHFVIFVASIKSSLSRATGVAWKIVARDKLDFIEATKITKSVRKIVLDTKIMYLSSQTVPGNHEPNISSTEFIIRAARRCSLCDGRAQMRHRIVRLGRRSRMRRRGGNSLTRATIFHATPTQSNPCIRDSVYLCLLLSEHHPARSSETFRNNPVFCASLLNATAK